MAKRSEETIYAVSSGAGKAGVAVIRVSGGAAGLALETLCGGLPPDRRAVVRSIRTRNGEIIDRGLVLWMPGPGTFTGEDSAEFQVHGSRAVVSAVLEALQEIDGLRPADAGEFARRAFENGKLDLTEVEGLADLIDAETEAQRRQALRQMEGAAGRIVEDWRGRLIGILALCEAGIDFADEDDVPAGVAVEVGPKITALATEIDRYLADGHRGEMIRDGLTVVIAGAPNVGKSSLMNALARRDVAIVSDIPGTTRDMIEVRLDLSGVPVTVVDTAGLRDSADLIEQEGVRRAEARARDSDLVLWMTDTASENPPEGLVGPETWIVRNKCDRTGYPLGPRTGSEYGLSVRSGDGIEDLLAGLSAWIGDRVGSGTTPLITRARHRLELEAAVSALHAAANGDYLVHGDLVAEDLRRAAMALGRITGRIDVEDVLDAVFGQFCIGK